jgi:hypothetical protein
MRTTLTLDDDVAARLRAESRRTGRPFKQVVNERLRMALLESAPAKDLEPYKIDPVSMGAMMSLDNIGAVLEQIEGVDHL